MKRLVLILAGVLAFSGISYAQHIGPGVPAKNWVGNIATPNFGLGYHFTQAEWDGVDIESHRIYAHLGAVFGDRSTPRYEVFLRLGAADLDAEDDGGSINFDGDTEPLYAAGIKGRLYQGRIFGWGGVLQGLYINSFADTVPVNGQPTNIAIEDLWEVELAFPAHAKIYNGLVYLGPVFYHSTADVIMAGFEGDFDEDHNVGAVGGVAMRFLNVSIEVEAKYKSDLSAGALVTFTF